MLLYAGKRVQARFPICHVTFISPGTPLSRVAFIYCRSGDRRSQGVLWRCHFLLSGRQWKARTGTSPLRLCQSPFSMITHVDAPLCWKACTGTFSYEPHDICKSGNATLPSGIYLLPVGRPAFPGSSMALSVSPIWSSVASVYRHVSASLVPVSVFFLFHYYTPPSLWEQRRYRPFVSNRATTCGRPQ